LAVSTTDQAWVGFAEASVWVLIMDRLPSSKELETFKDLKKDGMTETTSEWVGGGGDESYHRQVSRKIEFDYSPK
jgi:hypothetical protein